MIGQTISHYKILDRLGEGGMGEVYLAEDTRLDCRVALIFLSEKMQREETVFRVGRHKVRAFNHRILRERAFVSWRELRCAC